MTLEEFIIHFSKDWFKSDSGCENWAIEFIKLTSTISSKYDAWKIISIDSVSHSYCITRLYKDESTS